MNEINFAPVYPEIFLVIAASAILLIDMFLTEAKRHITFMLSIATLIVLAWMNIADFDSPTVYTFNNMFVSDAMSNLLKVFSYIAVGMTLV